MPEGDTVWLAGRRLDAALRGQVLLRTDFRVPRYATTDLSGHTVTEVVSRGKHLLTRIGDDLTLHTHFRMDGSWHLYRAGSSRRGGPEWQVRLVLETASWVAVGYRLPVIDLVARADECRLVGHLGPDVLGEDWDPEEAARRLIRDGAAGIGEALLDQRNLAGVGTMYMAEVCFLSGVSPWTPVADVDAHRVVARAHSMLSANRQRPEQVTTGDTRRGRSHWVFERRQCLRCGTPIATGAIGDGVTARVGYWCPHCQPGPAPTPTPVRELLGPRTLGRTRYSP